MRNARTKDKELEPHDPVSGHASNWLTQRLYNKKPAQPARLPSLRKEDKEPDRQRASSMREKQSLPSTLPQLQTTNVSKEEVIPDIQLMRLTMDRKLLPKSRQQVRKLLRKEEVLEPSAAGRDEDGMHQLVQRLKRGAVVQKRGERLPSQHPQPELPLKPEPQNDRIRRFLSIAHKTRFDEFIYLTRDPTRMNDHYNLEVTEFAKIESEGTPTYYTCSAKGFTLYIDRKPVEFIESSRWLQERTVFQQASKLEYFQNFRKFKCYKKWAKNVARARFGHFSELLGERLLLNNPIYQRILLDHRAILLQIESLRFFDFPKVYETPTMEQFREVQDRARAKFEKDLAYFGGELHRVTGNGFRAQIENLKTEIATLLKKKDEEKQKGGGRSEKQDVISSFGLPNSMGFGSRALMRAYFIKFVDMSYLLEFMTIESVGLALINTGGKLLNTFVLLSTEAESELFDYMVDNIEEKRHLPSREEGLFRINFEIREEEPRFEVTPVPVLTEEEQDAKAALAIKRRNLGQEAIDFEFDLVGYPDTFRRFSTESLVTAPSEQEVREFFFDLMKNCNLYTVVRRWRPLMHEYTAALEDWDVVVGGLQFETEEEFLSPANWLKEQQLYRGLFGEISKFIEDSFRKVRKFTGQSAQIIELFFRQQNTSEKAVGQAGAEAIRLHVTNMHLLLDLLQRTFEDETCIGLFTIFTRDIKRVLMDRQEAKIAAMLGATIDRFNELSTSCISWIEYSIEHIKTPATQIDEYARQREKVKGINQQLLRVREEVEVCKACLDSLSKHAPKLVIPLHREKQLRLSNLQTQLNSCLSEMESSADKNQDKYRKSFNEKLEELRKSCARTLEQVEDKALLDLATPVPEAIATLEKYCQDIKHYEDVCARCQEYEDLLQFSEPVDYDFVYKVKEEAVLRLQLWTALRDLEELKRVQEGRPFREIDGKALTAQNDGFVRIAVRAERGLPQNKVSPKLKKLSQEYKEVLPVVVAFKTPYLQEEHWAQIKQVLNNNFEQDSETFLMRDFLALPIVDKAGELQDISTKANQENMLRNGLAGVERTLDQTDLLIKQYKENNQVMAGMDETMLVLDEALASVNNILANRYVRRFRKEAERMSQDVQLLMDIIEKWGEAQRKWMYLENIFNAPDIKKQMATESINFQACDKFIKTNIKKISQAPKILRLLKIPHLFENLVKTTDTLQHIEKMLQDYLEVKRKLFPRFYFLSNDELLEILSNAANLQATEQHLGKCFEGLVRLYMGEGRTVNDTVVVEGIVSPEKEVVRLVRSFSAKGKVEGWLFQLQKEMYDAIRKAIKSGLAGFYSDQYKSRNDWVRKNKSQVVATVSQIVWTSSTEDAIRDMANKPNALSEHLEEAIKGLKSLTELVREDIPSLLRKIVVALITTEVHNRDITERLSSGEVESTSNFNWQQQLRYYFENEECVVRQVSSLLTYGYEYLGASSRLVITPLTDRCWITITSALSNSLGANPAGPAGTGKTESTKDLAKGLARLCIVFNCSDQITAAMMNKLFKGLAQQGAWACLDEFNRIDIEVLSVIAQQLLVIRIALLSKDQEMVFEGAPIALRPGYGCFITMNPGYAGRTELPDNLKSLFRPVSMMIPDYAMIAEIMLFAEGFEDASKLSKKMVQLYKLSSEQLSQQDHYDFGMRAVKSLLVMAGALKRAEPALSEDTVLIRAMKESNVPKFLKDDIPLFNALIYDLFPTIDLPPSQPSLVETRIPGVLKDLGYLDYPPFVQKINQLNETLRVRFGVMQVGQSGVGKSVALEVLARTMTELHKEGKGTGPVEFRVINPKSISMGELYGEVDPFTQEWVDGLASSIIRDVNNPHTDDPAWTPNNMYWVVFDGPVDALWIENMNTVLDDNMTLCLANSERIKLRPELHMLFEVQDLAVASPATVSRCGMVYLAYENLHWMNYVDRWLKRLPSVNSVLVESSILQLRTVFQRRLQGLFAKKKGLSQVFPTSAIHCTQNVCNILEAMLRGLKPGENQIETDRRVLNMFIYACLWGCLGSVTSQSYGAAEAAMKDVFEDVTLPRGDTIFDFQLNEETQKGFIAWGSKVPEFQYSKESSFFNLLVPTVDTCKFSHLAELMLENQRPLIFSGQSGVGKSVLVTNLLQRVRETKRINSILLNFSAQTKAKQTQLAIEGKLVKKGKTSFGARPNERIAIFVDDINMPELEFYGAQPCIELLRFFVDQKGFYDRQKLFFKSVSDTTLVAACAPPGGGRNMITPRLLRHLLVLNLPLSPVPTLNKIFASLLCAHYGANGLSAFNLLGQSLVSSTILLFHKISEQLLPTPSKFHYLFNLRDMGKVVQGMMAGKAKEEGAITRLWLHECTRVFADRFVQPADWSWFRKTVSEIRPGVDEGWFGTLWSDVLKLDSGLKQYEEVVDHKKLLKLLGNKQEDYNMVRDDKLDLVFFEDAVEQILRICRILRQPRGNGLLIGVGGSGKQSLAKLSSFIMKAEPYQIELVKNYNQEAFRGDLQKIARKSGGEQQSLSFIFTDVQIAKESFLEDINNLLNTGEVPNLFPKKEEVDQVIALARPHAVKQKVQDSPEPIWNFFVQSIRENLHVVLCMSPVGELLRVRCRKFPSLVTCCTLDWFPSWPKEALLEVASKFLGEIQFTQEGLRPALAEMCMEVSISVSALCERFDRELKRKVYTTPKSYLDQIKLYSALLAQRREEMEFVKRKLSTGLQKLFETNEVVASLKVEMTALQPQLAEQSEKTERFLAQLAIDSQEAARVEEIVQNETEIVNEEQSSIKKIADEAKAELDKALPILREAEEALNRIDKSQITEIKGFVSPPPAVVMVLSAVCILLGEKTDWQSAKKCIVEMGFIDRLKLYDRSTLSDGLIKKLKTVTSNEDFNPQFVSKKSQACMSLCMWVKAMENHFVISKEVEPKKKKVAEMSQKLEVKTKELRFKEDELRAVKDKVAKLQKECNDTMDLKRKLQLDMEKTEKRLVAAEKLNVLLADEGVRWKEQIGTIGEEINQLIGDVFLGAATISYLGPFTGVYRQPVVQKWMEQFRERNVPFSEGYSLASTLQTPIRIRQWNMEGLPGDSISIDNAVICTKCDRFPLMIDPQGEANKWIKKHEVRRQLKVVNFGETHFLKAVQTSISSGFAVLVEKVEERLQPSLDSVLQKQVVMQEGRPVIRVGDQRLDYHPEFFLYLTTKMANPHYLPEVHIKVTVINFSITFDGLNEQLLGEVMKHEQPKIEKQRDEIVVSIAEAKRQIKEGQDTILRLLSESEGMILDNDALIATLEKSKASSAEILRSLENTSIVEASINRSRNMFVPVSTRGTILYFVISDLSLVDPMYQYSLAYFKRLYNTAMDEAQTSEDLDTRLQALSTQITQNIFIDVCRGLFESHKKIFAYLICTSIRRNSGEIDPASWNLMLRGLPPSQEGDKPKIDNPDQAFIPKLSWLLLNAIAGSVPELAELPASIKAGLPQWKKWMQKQNVVAAQLPNAFPLKPFHRLLVVRAINPSLIMREMSNYVAMQMGAFYDEPKTPNLDDIFGASNANTPIIFILSVGADPTDALLKYAQEKGKQLSIISLGQGQGEKADVLIEKNRKEGGWVLLQNCHLAKSWMASLELKVLRFEEAEPGNQEFRLLLTSMPADYFPVAVLQNGVKLTTQPPRGLRANLKRALQNYGGEVWEQLGGKAKEWHRLLLSLMFFHAIVQERRKFGPLGFNIRYQFNDSDLDISVKTLQMFLTDNEEIPWDALLYMTGNINYGGRVTDDWDRVCLLGILRKYQNSTIIEEDKYHFSASPLYFTQPVTGLADYRKYVDGLPNFQNPEAFGLHENANITFQQQQSSKIMETVLSVQPRVASSAGGKSTDEVVVQLAKQFQSQLPGELRREEGLESHFEINEKGNMPSLSIVLLQEMEKFNLLLRTVGKTLVLLQKAIQGLVTMSQDLDEMYVAFTNNQLPPNWRKYSYASLKPLNSWYKDLQRRVAFLESWLKVKPPPSFWMSGLYFPQGFLTAVLQTYSRAFKTPIDTLGFSFKVLPVEKEKLDKGPVNGVFIDGLFLEGAGWDLKDDSLVDQQSGRLYFPMYIIHFLPSEGSGPTEGVYKCPCYKTSVRAGVLSTTGQSTNFILGVQLPTRSQAPDFWTLRATALLCQLDS